MFPPVKRILEQKDIDDVYRAAIRVLAEVGIQCGHGKAIEMLVGSGGVRYEGGRMFFRPEDMEALFAERQREMADRETVQQSVDFAMGGQWNCLELCDPVTNTPRPATLEEAADMARLAEALGSRRCPIPVAPGLVNPRLRTLECERIALLNTERLGGWLTATDREEVRILADMHKAAGRRYSLGLEGLITPLKLNPVIFDTYFEWCDDPDVDIGIMGGIPVAGATAPLVFPACFVLPLAEGLALDYISRAISGGKLRSFDFRLEPFDMRFTNLAYGTPEHCLLIQAMAELREGLFGLTPRHGVFRTNGKVVDAQTQLERIASFLWQAQLGARIFGSVGQMSVDEVYSPVQAILDRETLEYGRRLYAGVGTDCWVRDRDMVEIIREGVADNGFLLHDTTVGMFRSFYGLDRMCEASYLNGWRSRGSLKLEEKAWEEAKAIIGASAFQPAEQARRDVEKLYRKGVEALSGQG